MTGNIELVLRMHVLMLRAPGIPQAMYKAVDAHSAKAAACSSGLQSHTFVVQLVSDAAQVYSTRPPELNLSKGTSMLGRIILLLHPNEKSQSKNIQ